MSITYRVIFEATYSGNSGKVAEMIHDCNNCKLFVGVVQIIEGYTTIESIPNILRIAYAGLTDINPIDVKAL